MARQQTLESAAARPRGKVALVGLHSSRNLGDTAIFVAALEAVRARRPLAEIVVVAPDPVDSSRCLGVTSFPFYGDGAEVAATGTTPVPSAPAAGGRLAAMWRVFRFARTVDAVVFSGGGQLDDFWGGAWQVPFWLWFWVACARLRRLPVGFLGVGLDRLSSRASRWFTLAAVRGARYCVLRDDESRQLLVRSGLQRPCDVCPDLAFGLPPPGARAPEMPPQDRFVIVNPAASSMWAHGFDPGNEPYLQALLDLCRWLLARGVLVRMLSTQDAMDYPAMDYIAERLRSAGETGWSLHRVRSLAELFAQIAGAELVVSSRFHGLILPLVAGIPVVAVAPMRKMRRLMHDIEMQDCSLDLTDATSARLVALVEEVLQDRNRLTARAAAKVEEFRRNLAQHYDRLAATGMLGATG